MSRRRRDEPESTHPNRFNRFNRFEPLTRELIKEVMKPFWNPRTRITPDIREKGVTFSIKSPYIQPHIIDLESESITSKFGNSRHHKEGVRQHYETMRQKYWKDLSPNKIINNIINRDEFSTQRNGVFIGPSLNNYNGRWIVDGFALSNNNRFALIKATRYGYDAPKFAFLYDLRKDLLIGVR